MIDIRNQILERLPTICSGITGMVAVGTNCLDVTPRLARPAIIINDGTEETAIERPNSVRRYSQIQMMDLTPDIRLLLRADTGTEARELISLFRARVISSILNDGVLQGILGTNGAIRYGGCTSPDPNPETKEPRLDFTFVFSYPLRLSDLLA